MERGAGRSDPVIGAYSYGSHRGLPHLARRGRSRLAEWPGLEGETRAFSFGIRGWDCSRAFRSALKYPEQEQPRRQLPEH